jgi:hypothetical protein
VNTETQINVVLYGDKAKSDNIKFQTTFGFGYCNEYKVDINDIGVLFKLRVSLNDKKSITSYHLDRV